jgi:hypothetical protein
MKKLVATLVFLFFFSSFQPCLAQGPEMLILGGGSAAVNAYIYWKEGEAHKVYEYNEFVVYNAVLAALEEMKLPVKEEKGTVGKSIKAGNNDLFKIKVISMEKNITKLSCRINFMGDKPYAELLYRIVDEKLTYIGFQEKKKPVQPQKKPSRRLFRRNAD